MTFKEAVRNLDAEGKFGAKRPSMLGYAYKETTIPEDAEQKVSVHLVAKDGSKITLDLAFDDWGDINGVRDSASSSINSGSAVVLTAELATALVFAGDWELAPRDELEKARAGEGTM